MSVSSVAKRLGGLISRLRVDRRLPPPVTDLLTQSARVHRRSAADAVSSKLRRPRRNADTGELAASPQVARLGNRRVVVSEPLPRSLDEIGLRAADVVAAVLGEAAIPTFVVSRQADGLEFGVGLEDRAAAAAALVASLNGCWYVAYDDGGRSDIVALEDLGTDRRALRAREWNLFEAFGWGDRAVGDSAGCRLTFWSLGSSGQLEKIGTRGQSRFLESSETTIESVRGHEYPGRTAFPVGANFEFFDEPIDVVYTWVDGADATWQREFLTWRQRDGRETGHTAFDPARFTSRDEILYSLRSVWAYCGWVRRIYVVTSGQVPAWLRSDSRIRVVPHEEILPPEALPTFNSHAIEAVLHRIVGLSEHFVYFNDDMCVARPLRPEAFFTSNGLAKVFQSSALVPGAEDETTLAVDTGALRGRELLRERFGRVVSGKPYHAPYPLRRSVLERVEADFPEVFERTITSRFRAASDLSIAASFGQHYGLGLGSSVIGELATSYSNIESDRLALALSRIELADDLDAFCLNETHRTEGDHTKREARITAFFDRMYPIAAPWELPAW